MSLNVCLKGIEQSIVELGIGYCGQKLVDKGHKVLIIGIRYNIVKGHNSPNERLNQIGLNEGSDESIDFLPVISHWQIIEGLPVGDGSA